MSRAAGARPPDLGAELAQSARRPTARESSRLENLERLSETKKKKLNLRAKATRFALSNFLTAQ